MVKSIIIRWDYASDGDAIGKYVKEGLALLGINVECEGADLDDNFGIKVTRID